MKRLVLRIAGDYLSVIKFAEEPKTDKTHTVFAPHQSTRYMTMMCRKVCVSSVFASRRLTRYIAFIRGFSFMNPAGGAENETLSYMQLYLPGYAEFLFK